MKATWFITHLLLWLWHHTSGIAVCLCNRNVATAAQGKAQHPVCVGGGQAREELGPCTRLLLSTWPLWGNLTLACTNFCFETPFFCHSGARADLHLHRNLSEQQALIFIMEVPADKKKGVLLLCFCVTYALFLKGFLLQIRTKPFTQMAISATIRRGDIFSVCSSPGSGCMGYWDHVIITSGARASLTCQGGCLLGRACWWGSSLEEKFWVSNLFFW